MPLTTPRLDSGIVSCAICRIHKSKDHKPIRENNYNYSIIKITRKKNYNKGKY